MPRRRPPFAAALSAGLCAGAAACARPPEGPHPGQRLPALELMGLDGAALGLPRAGRPAVLRFWTSWCGPCRRELPELGALAEAHGEAVDVVSINAGEDPVRARLIAESWAIPGVVALDVERAAVSACAVDAVPLALVVDGDGLVRYRGPTLPAGPRGPLDGLLE